MSGGTRLPRTAQLTLEGQACLALPDDMTKWARLSERWEHHCTLLARAHEDGTPHRDIRGREWPCEAPKLARYRVPERRPVGR